MKKNESVEYNKRLENIAKAWKETSLNMVEICSYIEKINKLLMISKNDDKDIILSKGKYYIA